MLQPDRLEGVPGDRIATAEGLVPDPYVQEFEQRLAVLQPLFDYQTPGVKFDMDRVGLQPDKFTAAIFIDNGDSFEILLGKKTVSGYFQEDHWAIEAEHPEIRYYTPQARPAFIAEMNGLRFVMVDHLSVWEEEGEEADKLKDALERYGIAMAMRFEGDSKAIGSVMDDLGQGASSVSQYLQAIDKILFDGRTLQTAQRYGLTNNEYIRLRLQGELPPDKQKPIVDKVT